MKKILCTLLVITMVFAFSGCGSQEKGTKGVYEGDGYNVTWSKGFLNAKIKLTIEPTSQEGLFEGDFAFEEDLENVQYDAEGNILLPFSMSKEFKKNKMVYEITPIKENITEEIQYNTVIIKEVYRINETDIGDVAMAFYLDVNSSKDIPVSVSCRYCDTAEFYSSVGVSGDGDFSAGFKMIGGGLELSISNPSGDTWNVIDYDSDLFEVQEPYNSQAKTIIPVIAKAAGTGDVYAKNLQRGQKYKFHITVSAYENADGEVMGYNAILISCSAVKEKSTIKDTKNYKRVKKAAKQRGIDIDDVILPDDINVTDIDIIGGNENSKKTYTDIVKQEDERERGTSQGGKYFDNVYVITDKGEVKIVDDSVFETEEEKEAFKENVEQYELYMSIPERISADNNQYTMIEFKMVDSNNNSNAYVISKKSEVAIEQLIASYDSYKELSGYKKSSANVKGVEVTLILTDLISAGIFTDGTYNYVYECVGTSFTEKEAIEKISEYIK